MKPGGLGRDFFGLQPFTTGVKPSALQVLPLPCLMGAKRVKNVADVGLVLPSAVRNGKKGTASGCGVDHELLQLFSHNLFLSLGECRHISFMSRGPPQYASCR